MVGSPVPPVNPLQVQQLVYSAQQAMQTGRLDEAARLWSQVLALSPEHAQALFHLGQHKLLQKDASSAVQLLERAAELDANNPAIPLNIAFAQRTLGSATLELQALERALMIDPYFLPALLAKGQTLERVGKPRQAARIYKDALSFAPPAEQLQSSLRAVVEHARQIVDANAEELEKHLEQSLVGVRARQREAPRRFDMCKSALLGRKKLYTQQPVMLQYPELPPIQFYDNADFPWIKQLEASTGDIRAELIALSKEGEPAPESFQPYVQHPPGVPLNQWEELNFSPRWSVLFLWKDGVRIDAACRRCPATAAAVEAVPQAHIPNFSPTVNFSVLAPKTRIPPHTGSTNVRLIVHLPLMVPEGCTYRVGNETRLWEEGKAWVFDDTIEHEAWNGSDRPRAILMFDIWNPFLSDVEREMVSALLNGVQSYYGAEAPIQLGG